MKSPDRGSPSLITLTTDFGSRDGFVGAMKGVILSLNRAASIIDITHDIPSHDIAHGAFVLGTTCLYYPPDTIHVAVVDPGVGSSRNPLLLRTPKGIFIAPDNGILSHVLTLNMDRKAQELPITLGEQPVMSRVIINVPQGCEAFILDNNEYWLGRISNTFHGRDIFAPVAAHVSKGVPPESLGTKTEQVSFLYIPQPTLVGKRLQGHVIHVDRFGNLISNLRLRGDFTGDLLVEIEGARIQGLSLSYASGGNLLAIIGSHGFLEIAVRKGSAEAQLGASTGSPVTVEYLG